MTTEGPPKKQMELRPGESIIDAAIRELASNPDSPMSLKIMSAVSHAVAPRQRAADQVVDALEGQLLQPGEVQQEAVKAAILHWEREFKESMPSGMLGDLEHEARERIRKRSRQPPRMDSILKSYPATTDTGYDLGVHLEGLKGTWHCLWACFRWCKASGTKWSTMQASRRCAGSSNSNSAERCLHRNGRILSPTLPITRPRS